MHNDVVIRAAVLQTGRDGRMEHACAALGEAYGWDVRTIAPSWEAMVALWCSRAVDVGIVASMADLPPDRLPRLVALDEERPPEPPPIPGQRRPRILWRPSPVDPLRRPPLG